MSELKRIYQPKPETDFERFFSVLERTARWDARYLQVAGIVAGWSKDPSTKVGAVLVSADNRIIGTGYNGFLPGEDDSPELYLDRGYKYQHIVHAEINALGQVAVAGSALGGTMYVTFPPCLACSRAIIAGGVKRVVCRPVPLRLNDIEWTLNWNRTAEESRRFLEGCGVGFRVVPEGWG